MITSCLPDERKNKEAMAECQELAHFQKLVTSRQDKVLRKFNGSQV